MLGSLFSKLFLMILITKLTGASTLTASANFDESYINQYVDNIMYDQTSSDDTPSQDQDIELPTEKRPRSVEHTASAQHASRDIASLPIIDLSHVNILSKKEFGVAALFELIIIRKEVQGMRESQDQSSTYMLDKQLAFSEFDENLKTNKYLQNDITLSYLNMIKQFMTKGLVMDFSATRKLRNKENPKNQMKPLQFFKLMKINCDDISQGRKKITVHRQGLFIMLE
ncbi:hypothetical protein TSAR_008076 [Trichomalopsis sarcophagae]|uniref:PiggyBac transposable element-derived protein domain-containing protein n=1 Tax=Trichomalopsis sarcophagae TaxID=543379 RepID=A0A232FNP0_9HYME|nr:hypothetical protein TSAR_008076 [Trichomalopsis sarcophagae]